MSPSSSVVETPASAASSSRGSPGTAALVRNQHRQQEDDPHNLGDRDNQEDRGIAPGDVTSHVIRDAPADRCGARSQDHRHGSSPDAVCTSKVRFTGTNCTSNCRFAGTIKLTCRRPQRSPSSAVTWRSTSSTPRRSAGTRRPRMSSSRRPICGPGEGAPDCSAPPRPAGTKPASSNVPIDARELLYTLLTARANGTKPQKAKLAQLAELAAEAYAAAALESARRRPAGVAMGPKRSGERPPRRRDERG